MRNALFGVLGSASCRFFDPQVANAITSFGQQTLAWTREAFEVYRAHLSAGGIIAVNVSNIHIDFDPVMRGIAEEFGMAALRVSTDENAAHGQLPARWWLLSAHHTALGAPALRRAADARVEGDAILWTDDFSSLIGVLR